MIETTNREALSSEAERYLLLVGSVAPVKGAAYVAVPITSGSRFLSWYNVAGARLKGSEEYAQEHKRSVIEPNCADASLRIAAIRDRIQLPVIDPTKFDRPGWTQAEYRRFWAAVVERYACRVILLDGWHYSNGCSFEFLTANNANITTLDERFQPLPRVAGLKMIEDAVSEYQRYGVSAPFLETVADKLKSVDFPVAG